MRRIHNARSRLAGPARSMQEALIAAPPEARAHRRWCDEGGFGEGRATARISARASWMRPIASLEPFQPNAARRKRARNPGPENTSRLAHLLVHWDFAGFDAKYSNCAKRRARLTISRLTSRRRLRRGALRTPPAGSPPVHASWPTGGCASGTPRRCRPAAGSSRPARPQACRERSIGAASHSERIRMPWPSSAQPSTHSPSLRPAGRAP